jgi:hypothetical protein
MSVFRKKCRKMNGFTFAIYKNSKFIIEIHSYYEQSFPQSDQPTANDNNQLYFKFSHLEKITKRREGLLGIFIYHDL